MPETYSDLAIIIEAQIEAVAARTAIDLKALVKTLKASGVSDELIIRQLADDLEIGGRIFSQYKSGVKNVVRDSLMNAGNTASLQFFENQGVQMMVWVTESGNPCPDCAARDGRAETLEYWKAAGMPKSGFSVCGSHCQCVLVPV